MEVKVIQDNKINILDDFLGKDREIVNSNFQKGSYAKKLRLLAKGVLPKEYRVEKHVYSRGEHL